MTLKRFIVAVVCLFLMAALVIPLESPPMKLPLLLALGWFGFLQRVAPHVSPDWNAIASAIGCLILLGGVLHWLGRWAATWPADVPIAWYWTKAPMILVGVVALFGAGLASVGLVRATSWLTQMEESFFVKLRSDGIQSSNCLKQQGLAVHDHNDALKEMPAGTTFDRRGIPLHGWQTALLPFVEQPNIYEQIRLDLPWNHPVNRAHFRWPVQVYEDPELGTHFKGEFPVTHYSGNVYVLGGRALRIPRDFADGTSNTVVMGQAAGNFPPWGRPLNWRDPSLGINRGPNSFGHPRAPGTLFALCDASVRFVSEKISPATLKALATPAGGEFINDPEW